MAKRPTGITRSDTSSRGAEAWRDAGAAGALATLEGERLSALRASEWVLTNGLGGFAMGTVSGTPERRYHALLVAARKPPVGRVATLLAVDECLVLEGDTPGASRHHLTSIRFGGSGETGTPMCPHLRRFVRSSGVCRWEFEIGAIERPSVRVTRELALVPGRNAAVLRYNVGSPNQRARLELRPLVALRDFHRTLSEREGVWRFTMDVLEGADAIPTLSLAAEGMPLRIRPSAPARFVQERWWWRNFEYRRDLERGQSDGREDLFCPGAFVVECGGAGRVGESSGGMASFEFGAWCDDAGAPGSVSEIARAAAERNREGVESYLARTATATPGAGVLVEAMPALLQAADQFIVARAKRGPSTPGVSIIAGYPWFSDWGRDTMIAMRGLLLARGRFDEARATLDGFAAHMRNGLIPNAFDDASGDAEYNTADAPLWFIQASCDYLERSGDAGAFAGSLAPACLEIVRAYRAGTEHGIRMDSDGLIVAGAEGTQLTWMDAKRDGDVFTPRHGKPVELSALWCSGLRRLAGAIGRDRARESADFLALAELASVSFRAAFWDPTRSCLFDCLAPSKNGWVPSRQVRPNQVFAVSLPSSPLSREQQRGVVSCVRDQLLTPMGLRTLDARDPHYRGRFEGSLFERDRAYHNGTAWPWLVGPYAEAVLRVGEFSPTSRAEALAAITPLLRELCASGAALPASISTLAEVYDGDDTPERPRRGEGCMAQAWSLGEVLRIATMLL